MKQLPLSVVLRQTPKTTAQQHRALKPMCLLSPTATTTQQHQQYAATTTTPWTLAIANRTLFAMCLHADIHWTSNAPQSKMQSENLNKNEINRQVTTLTSWDPKFQQKNVDENAFCSTPLVEQIPPFPEKHVVVIVKNPSFISILQCEWSAMMKSPKKRKLSSSKPGPETRRFPVPVLSCNQAGGTNEKCVKLGQVLCRKVLFRWYLVCEFAFVQWKKKNPMMQWVGNDDADMQNHFWLLCCCCMLSKQVSKQPCWVS